MSRSRPDCWMRAAAAALVLLPAGRPTRAQVAALGAPPAGSDSVYRRALDTTSMPRFYRRFPFVYLLDELVEHRNADGSGTRAFRQVAQVLSTDGVRTWAERTMSYQPDQATLRINWIRVVRPNGEVISDQPVVKQESDVPASPLIPIYMLQRVMRVSLAGVTAGTMRTHSP